MVALKGSLQGWNYTQMSMSSVRFYLQRSKTLSLKKTKIFKLQSQKRMAVMSLSMPIQMKPPKNGSNTVYYSLQYLGILLLNLQNRCLSQRN